MAAGLLGAGAIKKGSFMTNFKITRRNFVKTTAAGAAGLSVLGLPTMASAAGLTIGIVYVGPRDDFGWNQAHAEAAKVLKTLPYVTVVEE